MAHSADQNVFVGVSLQNKGLTESDYSAIVSFARERFHFRRLLFLVADQIELINQRVFSRGTERRHSQAVEAMALSVEKTIVSSCDPGALRSGSISTCRWTDILDSNYWQCFFELERIFSRIPAFRGDVLYAIEEYARRRDRFLSEGESLYLSTYILHELPTLVHGVQVRGKWYRSMIYPAPVSARIDRIAQRLIDETYALTFFKPPFCTLERYEIRDPTENRKAQDAAAADHASMNGERDD